MTEDLAELEAQFDHPTLAHLLQLKYAMAKLEQAGLELTGLVVRRADSVTGEFLKQILSLDRADVWLAAGMNPLELED
jgi:hypothetical protein